MVAKPLVQMEGYRNPFRDSKMVEMFVEVMAEESRAGIVPFYGSPHEWSPEFRRQYHSKYSLILRFPKLLVVLARGESSRMLFTGTETELRNYLLGRPERSVYPEEIFRASYRLNRGDVYLTLLTIENILSEHWTFKNRENDPTYRRLALIHNQIGEGGKGYGVWYHLFGIMLYGYVYGAADAHIVSSLETLGRHILNHFQLNDQEDHANRLGGRMGAALARAVKRRGFDRQVLDPRLLLASSYLSLDEDFRDRIPIEPTPGLHSEVFRDELKLESDSAEFKNCLLEVFLSSNGRRKISLKLRYSSVSLKAGHAFQVFIPALKNTSSVRLFLSGCEQGQETVSEVNRL